VLIRSSFVYFLGFFLFAFPFLAGSLYVKFGLNCTCGDLHLGFILFIVSVKLLKRAVFICSDLFVADY